ncbi:MAG: DMT family transporter [Rhodobacteraceae bacterium]|nr:DMT family transporter [Paracoccaceae bacterium]
MTASQSHPLAGLALGFVGVALFGATLPMTPVALAGFDPAFLTFARAVIASAAAGLALLLLRRKPPVALLGQIATAGFLLVYGFPLLSSLAMQTVPAAHGGVVLGILPLLTAVFAAIFGGERPGGAFWAFGILGAALVLGFTLAGGDAGTAGAGDVWLGLAALSAACGYVLFGRLSRQLPGWEVIAWALMATAPLSLAGTARTWPEGIHSPGPSQFGALAYLGLCSMFLGFVFWNAGLAMGGIARVGQVQLLQTFVTLGVSAALLGEKVTPMMLSFALAVGAVVWLGRKARVATVVPAKRP